MNRHPAQMRGRDAGGSGDRHGNLFVPQVIDVLIEKISFARTGGARNKNIHPAF